MFRAGRGLPIQAREGAGRGCLSETAGVAGVAPPLNPYELGGDPRGLHETGWNEFRGKPPRDRFGPLHL